jgi:hypothetical protein
MTVTTVLSAVVITFSPNLSHFGQVVTATVRGPGTPSFAPFAVVGRRGDEYELQCLDPSCLPEGKPRVLTIGGHRLVITPRVSTSQVGSPERSFRRPTTPTPPSYRVRPSLLQALLLAGAAGLVALGTVLAWPLVRRRRRARPDTRTPLERALAFVRASLSRGPDDRRRALDLLARTVEPGAGESEALSLAWSEPDPDPGVIESVLAQVEPKT